MATQQRVPWSLWNAFLMGSVLSAVLVGMHFARGVEPYPSQTVAGQVAYWFGYAGIYPVVFVVIAAIRNAFIPKDATAPKATTGFRNFFWPTNLKAEPRGVARLGRVLHWLLVAGALAFVVGGFYTLFLGYDYNSGFALIVFGGGFCFFAGRALRYIFAGE